MDTTSQFILYVIGSIAGFLLTMFLLRIIFRISKFIKYQQAQVELLAEIAASQKIPIKVINSILASTDLVLLKDTTLINEEEDTDLEKEALSHPKE